MSCRIAKPVAGSWPALLDWLRAVGAAGRVFPNGVIFVSAIAVVARLTYGIRHSRNLIGGVHILIVHRDLGAVGKREGITRLLSAGQVRSYQLSCLRRRRSRLGIAAKCRQRAGEAIGRVLRVVLQLRLPDGPYRLYSRDLVALFAQLQQLGYG